MSKKIIKMIETRVEDALAGFSKNISEKKFKKHIKKAGKILSDGLKFPTPSSNGKNKTNQSETASSVAGKSTG